MASDAPQFEYTIRRKIFTILGAKFHIFNQQGELIGFSRQKAFRLKEDIRVFSDETQTRPLIGITARNIIDFSAAYDVTDSQTGNSLGALRRKGFSSMVRDSWEVLDTSDQPVAALQEDSAAMALARRFVPMGNLIPQTFHLADGSGNTYAQFRTHFNPFVHRLTVSIYPSCPVDPMVVLAGGVLLLAIEGRQQS